MPIRPENRRRYPADWALRSRFVREVRARGCCEWCGVRNGSVIQPIRCCGEPMSSDARGPGWCCSCERPFPRVVLTTAHVYDHRPEAASLLNLAALCQRCHNRHDAKERRRGIRDRALAAAGQLELAAIAKDAANRERWKRWYRRRDREALRAAGQLELPMEGRPCTTA